MLRGSQSSAEPDAPATRLTRFVVRERERFVLLPVAEVEWIRAAENYVELHARGTRGITRSRSRAASSCP